MEENNWVYGEKIGHQFKYYDQQDTVIIIDENGEPMLTAISAIKAYDYINSLGGISYSIEYDKSEGVIDQRGHTVVAYSLDKENIFKGDTLNVHLKFPLIEAEITPTLFSVEGKDQYRFIDSLEINYDYMKSDFSVIINSKITLAIISKMRVKSFEVIDTSFISTIEPNI